MNPRAEIVTMNAKGLADFLMELKRTKTRHINPFEKFVADAIRLCKKPKDRKIRESATWQRATYAKIINQSVAAWEAKQAATVAEARVVTGTEAGPFASAMAGLNANIADMRADALKAKFQTVRFYVGALNRDINDNRVTEYATAMEKGMWWFTPDPIVVTDAGDIINGQHRLLAAERLIQEDEDFTPPQFVVVWGVDKRAAILMDEARRSATDRRDIALRFAAAATAP